MEHHKEVVIGVLKMAPAWIAVMLGHAIESITLSDVAFAASIVYSVVHTYATIVRMRGE